MSKYQPLHYTRVANPYNSTPFSSCCGIASMTRDGSPDDHCHGCGEKMHWHDNGLGARRREIGPDRCIMCGQFRSKCNC